MIEVLGIEGVEMLLLLMSLLIVCFFMERILQQMFFPMIALSSIPLVCDTIIPVYCFLDKFNGLNKEMATMLGWAIAFVAIFWISLLMSFLVFKRNIQ
ncbi:MAG: hypothetical protein Athens071425_409 [Parcubacteria group bacterium Athens0714_25]|nr:MAG: hypothetical protein Athens071425_409 [Parcubacteria group bacterium Athens0714_25]